MKIKTTIMKIGITICLLISTAFTANAQKIKNYKGQSEAINEVTQTITANPENLSPGWQKGFNVDFTVTYGLQSMYKTSYVIQIHEIKPNTSKGFYYHPSGQKCKYYNCSSLGDLCNDLQLQSANIVAVWSYNGTEYRTGSIQLSPRNGSFLNCSTDITNPNSTAIPYNAVKSGEAKVVRIEFVSWGFKKQYDITETIRTTYFK